MKDSCPSASIGGSDKPSLCLGVRMRRVDGKGPSSGRCEPGVTLKGAEWARQEAQRLVEPLGRRWLHVQAVAARAAVVAAHADLGTDVLVSAAWLHDVGYATEVATTGFHPLDGARHLRRLKVDEHVTSLVAYHSCAEFEAEERGLLAELTGEFAAPEPVYADALCYCDMTNGPAGAPVAAADRLDEIQVRYGPGHVVTRFVERARPNILAAVARTDALMSRH